MKPEHTPTQYDLTHLAMVGPDGIPVFLIPSATPDQQINARRKAERAFIVKAVNCHEEFLRVFRFIATNTDSESIINKAAKEALARAEEK